MLQETRLAQTALFQKESLKKISDFYFTESVQLSICSSGCRLPRSISGLPANSGSIAFLMSADRSLASKFDLRSIFFTRRQQVDP